MRMLFWPGWKQLGFATALGLAELVLFVVVYGGANWITSQHDWRVPLHMPVDSSVPLVPPMTVVYLTLNPMFWLMAFILRTRAEILAFVGTLAMATLVAGVFFLSIPGEHFHRVPGSAELGIWQNAYRGMRTIALEHNYVPSLHVAFTVICVMSATRYGTLVEKAAFTAWGLAIVASTLLTHQHYLLDVLSGLLLGWLAMTFGYQRWLDRLRSHAAGTRLPSPAIDPLPET